MKRSLLFTFFVCSQLVACTQPDGPAPPDEIDFLDKLRAIPGVTVQEGPTTVADYRYFVLEFDQPGDHDAPDASPHFQQRVMLLHRNDDAPMVLGTSGYFANTSKPRLYEPAQLLEANQLWVEQRFFAPSRPDPADWSWLTIKQAATDHHRIVEALKPLYTGKWISSGASKGGMTSVYHRRFFPNDVEGTVAYVAPHSVGTSDPRYLDFVANLGDADCRKKLADFQREILIRRPAMMASLATLSGAHGYTFDLLGEDQALETAAVEFAFTFWQYFDASRCPNIPTAASTDTEVWDFLSEINPPIYWSDAQVLGFEPYYWQASVELGYPALEESHLSDLLKYPKFDVPTSFVLPGTGKTPTFKPEAMQDVTQWLDTEGLGILFVYGQNDPYSAAAFDIGNAKDTFEFFAPGKNHFAKIVDLVEADRLVAFDALERWSGKTPVIPAGQPLEVRETFRER